MKLTLIALVAPGAIVKEEGETLTSTPASPVTEAVYVAEQDVSVTLAGDMLTIQGERKRESEETKPHFHRMERTIGSFSRSFSLPEDADPGSIHAHCENGELTISIARKAGSPAKEPVRVPVD